MMPHGVYKNEERRNLARHYEHVSLGIVIFVTIGGLITLLIGGLLSNLDIIVIGSWIAIGGIVVSLSVTALIVLDFFEWIAEGRLNH